MVNCICDQILSENICRNINHRNLLLNMHGTDSVSSTSKCETQSGKIKFAQCRILHALHKLCKKRARKTTVVQADSSVTLIVLSKAQSPFSRAIYIFIYQSCLVCQHLIQIRLITLNCVKNYSIINAHICPCDYGIQT